MERVALQSQPSFPEGPAGPSGVNRAPECACARRWQGAGRQRSLARSLRRLEDASLPQTSAQSCPLMGAAGSEPAPAPEGQADGQGANGNEEAGKPPPAAAAGNKPRSVKTPFQKEVLEQAFKRTQPSQLCCHNCDVARNRADVTVRSCSQPVPQRGAQAQAG